jgi:hypothetical protein
MGDSIDAEHSSLEAMSNSLELPNLARPNLCCGGFAFMSESCGRPAVSVSYADELDSRECVMAISAWRTTGLASLSARAAAAAVVSRPHSRSQDPEGSVGCSS